MKLLEAALRPWQVTKKIFLDDSRITGFCLIIWPTIISIYLIVPVAFPLRTWCNTPSRLSAYDYILEAIPIIIVFLITIAPVWVSLELIKKKLNIIQFTILIFTLYIFSIMLFAILFYQMGIIDTAYPSDKEPVVTPDFDNYIYYSAVTFTTLGYGDFKPCHSTQFYAAAEAFLGAFFMPFASAVILGRVINDHTSKQSDTTKRDFPWTRPGKL